jgi:hypothetical protein
MQCDGHFCTLTTNGWLLEKHAALWSGLDLLVISWMGRGSPRYQEECLCAFIRWAAGCHRSEHHPLTS